ncbi:Coiled-coil domain-containing protein 25 [Metarhizium anisopliae]
MVYYFTSSAVEPPGFIYDLIRYGWDEDVWFHVDKLSSAHVYLRMREGQTWDALPDALLADLAQLTKANSIEGTDNVAVIYTPWSNLRKDGSMDVGQVSFKDARKVRRVLVAARENPVVNRLNRTRVEQRPDLKQLRDERLAELRRREQAAAQTRRKEEARQAQEWKERKWAKDHAYDDMFTEENMAGSSNRDRGADWEDDFM